MYTIYGITSCDAVRKARKHLESSTHDFTFHDVKKVVIDADVLKTWFNNHAVDLVVNTKSQTWKKLGLTQEDQSLTITIMV